MREWVLRFDGMPPGPNARLHWARRAAEAHRWRVGAMVRCWQQEIPQMLPRIRLSAVFYRTHLGVADPDNDAARLKPLVDGIVAAGVIPTDTYRYVEYGTITEARGAPGVELVITEVEG